MLCGGECVEIFHHSLLFHLLILSFSSRYMYYTYIFESSPELIVLDRCYKQRPCLVWCVFSFSFTPSFVSNTIASPLAPFSTDLMYFVCTRLAGGLSILLYISFSCTYGEDGWSEDKVYMASPRQDDDDSRQMKCEMRIEWKFTTFLTWFSSARVVVLVVGTCDCSRFPTIHFFQTSSTTAWILIMEITCSVHYVCIKNVDLNDFKRSSTLTLTVNSLLTLKITENKIVLKLPNDATAKVNKHNEKLKELKLIENNFVYVRKIIRVITTSRFLCSIVCVFVLRTI